MQTTLNQSGQTTLSNFSALLQEASLIHEASAFSSAIPHYLAQTEISNQPEERRRQLRNRAWAQAALATFQQISAREVCLFWSEQADIFLNEVFSECFAGHKTALFALGKLGSQELNLSSDVDLIIVSEQEHPGLIPCLRKFQKILSDRTANGFVFRVDFDLRPGGRHGPLVPTVDQFKDYYGNYGETWERLAFVRLRKIAGSEEIGSEILNFSKKFTYRRHLDFTLLQDLKNLRYKIHAQHWNRSSKNGIDLKLGIGAIRDVELFVHALQVVHGGKDTELQVSSTAQAFDLLERKKLLLKNEIDFLRQHYWNLRQIENYVQTINDEQTHILKLDAKHPVFVQEALSDIQQDMAHCDRLVQSLLGEAPQKPQTLEDQSFANEKIQTLWNEILEQEALSHSKERDEAARQAFLEEFVSVSREQGAQLERSLLLLKDFVKETRAKATFFSLLLREKKLLREIAWLFGHSPYLSRILCNRPELLDSFVYRSQDKLSEDWSILLEELAERKLLSEIINGSTYLKDRNVEELNKNLSSTADGIVIALLERLKMDFPSKIKVLALGKWGGQELGFRSDLDFIFVTDGEVTDNDFKLARRLISRLTDAHKGGQIYSIDMRLRPTGKAGPLVITEEDLKNYLLNEASPWERQAYLKSRWVGDQGFDLASLCVSKGLTPSDLIELERIRRELIPQHNEIDLKYSEGGLIDLEFSAQILCLLKQIKPLSSSTHDLFVSGFTTESATFEAGYSRLRQIEQMLQLVATENISKPLHNHELFQFLATALQESQEQLKNEIDLILSQNLQQLNRLDPRRLS